MQLTAIAGVLSGLEGLTHSISNWKPGPDVLYTSGDVHDVESIDVMTPEKALAELEARILMHNIPTSLPQAISWVTM